MVTQRINSWFLYSCLFLLMACGRSDKEMAAEKINRAKELLAQLDTVGALANLDSVSILFPKAKEEITRSEALIRSIYLDQLSLLQSKLEETKLRITFLEKNFVKSKEKYDKYTQYIHKRQVFKNSWDRCFLQVHLDERGEIYLSSNYYGDYWLKHSSIRVYDGDLSAKTEVVSPDSPDNRQNDFMEGKWEMVSYRGDKSNEVIDLISKNVKRKLKVVFLGKKNYYIVMENFDKNAVREAKILSESLKIVQTLQEEIRLLESKINKLSH